MSERFLTDDEWSSMPHSTGLATIIKWRDLTTNKLFGVQKIEKKNSTKYGVCYVLHLFDHNHETIMVWGPQALLTDIRKSRTKTQRPYIISFGIQTTETRTYARFEVSYQQLQKEVVLFEDDEVEDQE